LPRYEKAPGASAAGLVLFTLATGQFQMTLEAP
jgi:hypothetical protein